MSAHPSSHPSLLELETPCALVDLETLEANLSRIAREASAAGISVRPHAKTHKCPAIAARQLAHGAVGVTVATLEEARGMADAGVEDVLVYYPTVGETPARKLLDLADRIRVSTTVETVDEAELLDRAARSRGTSLDVLIDVDTGLNRTGVRLGAELEALALAVERMASLRVAGIGTHEGFVYAIRDPGERRRVVEERLSEFAEAGRALGVGTISCGATPSLETSLAVDGITEIRPGNYAFMDAIQVDLGVADLGRCAFTVLSTVVSVRDSGQATVDAGSKVLTSDRGAHGVGRLRGHGLVVGRPELTIPYLSEEHGFLRTEGGAPMTVGERIRIIPNHSCAAVASFGWLAFVDGERLVSNEPLAGRRGDRVAP